MWLLEVNLCPTMEHSTKVTANLVPKVMEDMCKVIIDEKASGTGDFELIYEGQKVSNKE
jgi:tubulin monoglycylase TTLL3/8